LNRLLKTKLREHALVLRDLSSKLRSSGKLSGGDITNVLRAKKEELLSEIYGVMSATLGVPPQPNDKFVWDYYDKDGKAGRWEGTAKQFYTVRRKCYQLWGSEPHGLIYLGILEQKLSGLRCLLSNQ
jgi:bleomycin hydrolase